MFIFNRPRKVGSRLNRRWTNPLTIGGPIASATYRKVVSHIMPTTQAEESSSPKHDSKYPPLSAFPKSLPNVFIPNEAIRTYGISKPSRAVKKEVKDFVDWSTTSIQLDRSERYSASVQRTTTDKQETSILAYLGYLVNIKGEIADTDASISAYSSPFQFSEFMGFLQARDVGRGHILKHVSLARKVNNFLTSGMKLKSCFYLPPITFYAYIAYI